MAIVILAFKSMFNRRFTVLLTIAAIAFSVTLLLGVERIRQGARTGFANTISGTDLIVGARSGPIQLLLYSVFRIGDATNNISWGSYQEFANHPQVQWTIPISLGDSHRGFRVMGTDTQYFKYFKYGRSRPLELAEGRAFSGVFETVLGSEVAKDLGYELGQKIVVSHGISAVSFQKHKNKPFTIVGILGKTGTPVDRTVHVSLEGIEAMHIDWQTGGPPVPGQEISAEEAQKMDLRPKLITAFLVGMKSKIFTFKLQRSINEYRKEPLLAILPGATLQQLWGLLGTVETALLTISAFVVLTGLLGMLIAILTSLNERRREMAILRSVGARPIHVFSLMLSEAGLLSVMGSLTGVIFLYILLFIVQPMMESRFGIVIELKLLTSYELFLLGLAVGTGVLMGCFPAWQAYRNSLSDGMTIRI